MTDFKDLGVSEKRVEMLKAMGIITPTPVQEETIPIVTRGRDVISQAQTGTGKTLAFVLPMLDKINPDLPHVQGLIVTPTRELALQITAEIKKLLEPRGAIKVLIVYGGQDVEAQLIKLKGNIHLVIATPGRLLDHLRRETISLANVSMLVLDEADQMLHMGFLTEVEEVLRHTPPSRQTMLFSATMPPSIRDMAGRILRNPEHVTVKAEKVTVKDIRQWVVETADRAKQETLVKLLESEQPYLAMIFCRTKRRASMLNQALQEMGYSSDELHGDLSQAKREKVMKMFRDARLQLLVATDVAARGLDVEGVTHVFNYDIPQDVESYIHRIGRTGRAGESGLAITLVAPRDQRELADIENGIEQVIERRSDEGKPLGGRKALQPRGEKPFRAGSGGGRNERSGRAGEKGGRGGDRSRGGGGKFASGGRPAAVGGERKMAGKGKRGNEEAERRSSEERAAARSVESGSYGRKPVGRGQGRPGAGGPGGRRTAERGGPGTGGAGGGKPDERGGFSRPGSGGSSGRKQDESSGYGRSASGGSGNAGHQRGANGSSGRSPGPKSGGGSVGRSSGPKNGGGAFGRSSGPKSGGGGGGFHGSQGPAGGNRGGGGGRRSAPRGR